MKRDYRVYLRDIFQSLGKVERYTEGLSFDSFSKDVRTIDAVIRNLEVIGEATKRIPKQVRKKHPQVPWRAMAGMRNKLIHEYFGVDVEVLWKTIEEDLPGLRPLIEDILKETG